MTKVWVAIIGTRAQLVKMAPVLLAAEAAGHKAQVILTGQHEDTMVELADDLGVRHFMPVSHVGSERSTILKLITWAPIALYKCASILRVISKDAHVDWVLVHGDTASTLIGAVSAKLNGCRVAHIEGGLSSLKVFNPFPEEIIRRVVARMAFASFCPDLESTKRMKVIGVPLVVNTCGNTIIDALTHSITKNQGESSKKESSIIVSLHRFENIMSSVRLEFLVNTICSLSELFKVYLILHPPTHKRLIASDLLEKLKKHKNVVLQARMNYSEFMSLVSGAEIVLTDGGSNQEELAFLGIPTILMRDYTERPDGLGENVVFEGSLGLDLVSYVSSGRYLELKKNRGVALASSPAKLIVDSLATNIKG